ncbi:GNAT family N-acetyltransferase [Sporosarcina obsidiansis]|uniref:GNAT family N-acetyltransferase n=1 Tax=Sporosarcina obsidiansis TaxID=2660748 RepID=UPI00129A8190|nr:GNAT family N-acetyltransferase [Sporosarcina obsidiansis]
MKIKLATANDAPIIHDVMIKAFLEYKNEIPPSSALEETVPTITAALEKGEKALIGYMQDEPVAMVRFQLEDHRLYFFRLSVIPERQGQGIAKELLRFLETYAKQNKLSTIQCKVRMSLPKNLAFYQSIGYDVYQEEVLQKPSGIDIRVACMEKYL